METQIIKVEEKQNELTTIEEIIAGCDSAVVTYGLDKDLKIHKAVTFFSKTSPWIYEFEEYGGAHNKTLAMNPKIALAQSWDYKIQGKIVKRIKRFYHKVLFRTLSGFVKDEFTHDLRDMYEKAP